MLHGALWTPYPVTHLAGVFALCCMFGMEAWGWGTEGRPARAAARQCYMGLGF